MQAYSDMARESIQMALRRGGSTEPGTAIVSSRFDREIDTIENPAGVGGGGGGPYPFDAILTADPGTPGYSIATIQPGTINGILPSNYSTTYTLDDTLVYFLVASVTVSAGQITAVTLSMPTSPPAGVPVNMGQPPLSFTYLLGVVVDGVWYRVIGNGSLSAISTDVYHTDKTSPSPGTLPYDIWYTWNLVQA